MVAGDGDGVDGGNVEDLMQAAQSQLVNQLCSIKIVRVGTGQLNGHCASTALTYGCRRWRLTVADCGEAWP